MKEKRKKTPKSNQPTKQTKTERNSDRYQIKSFQNVFATMSCLVGKQYLRDISGQELMLWLISKVLCLHNMHLLLHFVSSKVSF